MDRIWEDGAADGQGYRIDADPAAERLHIAFRGFWTEALAQRFARDLDLALHAMLVSGAAPGHHLVTLDLRDHAVMSREMVVRFQAFSAGPGQMARRVAVLVQGTLQTMQLRRVASPLRNCRFFLLESEAEMWLAEAADELV